MLNQVLLLSAIIFTVESACFFARGNALLSPRDIAKLGVFRLDYNSDVLQNLAKQGADYKVGIVLLLVSFVLQIAPALLRSDTPSNPPALTAIVISGIIGLAVFLICQRVAARVTNTLYQDALDVAKKLPQEESAQSAA